MTSAPLPVEPLAYRAALGRFATGVVVVTTRCDGQDHAMTVNSFTSVSLDPPLVLFCCEKVARFHEAVGTCGTWIASVLAEDQQEASRWFATRGRPFEGQFDRFPTRPGDVVDGLALDGALAIIECRTVGAYDGGDHTIVVGEVVAVSVRDDDASPLLYFSGGYRTLVPPAVTAE